MTNTCSIHDVRLSRELVKVNGKVFVSLYCYKCRGENHFNNLESGLSNLIKQDYLTGAVIGVIINLIGYYLIDTIFVRLLIVVFSSIIWMWFNFERKPLLQEIIKSYKNKAWQDSEKVNHFLNDLKTEYYMNHSTLKHIDTFKGVVFEEFIAELIRKMGFKNVAVTKGSGDEGVDVIGTDLQGNKTALQCKRWTKNVGVSAVREVYSGMTVLNCDRAVVAITSYYTEPAKNLAFRLNVELWDREKIMELHSIHNDEVKTLKEFLQSRYIPYNQQPDEN